MQIKSASFVTSVADSNFYKSDFSEIAFVGRSNVGKSSLINLISGRRSLAKISGTPGKTKLINYFLINNQFLLVDLPGYGYAKVSKTEKTNWAGFLEEYLTSSPKLKCVYLLLDIRRTPTEQDEMMLKFLYSHRIPVKIVVTKIDTLSRSQVFNNLYIICDKIGVNRQDIILTSSQEKSGVNELLDSIESHLLAQN